MSSTKQTASSQKSPKRLTALMESLEQRQLYSTTTFTDPLTAALQPAIWTPTQSPASLYTVSSSSSGTKLTRAANADGGNYDIIHEVFNLAALNANLTGDFSAQIHFADINLSTRGQLGITANFSNGSYFWPTYSVSPSSVGTYVYVAGRVNGFHSGAQASGTLTITRTGSTLAGYLGTTLIYSETNTATLSGLEFELDNNLGPSSPITATFSDFSITAPNIVQPGSISGTAFSDTNGNGKQDSGEKGLAGVTLYIDSKKTGSFVTGDPTAVTNSSGAYNFSGLAAGTYQVREVLPAGDKLTAPTAGAFSITLSPGQQASGYAFADEPPLMTASISGTVFGDSNGNGKKDSTELGLGLWTVYLDLNDDGKLDTGDKSATTDINGNFSFTSLAAGTYYLRIVPVAGDASTTPTLIKVVLTAGEISKANLFGEE